MEPASPAIKIQSRAKNKYLESAQLRIPSPELLINVVRLRVRQLTQGYRPLTQVDPQMEFVDIAMKEISEGKMGYEFGDAVEYVPEMPAAAGVDPALVGLT